MQMRMRRRIHASTGSIDTCMYEEEDTCMSYEHEEEDTCQHRQHRYLYL